MGNESYFVYYADDWYTFGMEKVESLEAAKEFIKARKIRYHDKKGTYAVIKGELLIDDNFTDE